MSRVCICFPNLKPKLGRQVFLSRPTVEQNRIEDGNLNDAGASDPLDQPHIGVGVRALGMSSRNPQSMG